MGRQFCKSSNSVSSLGKRVIISRRWEIDNLPSSYAVFRLAKRSYPIKSKKCL